MYFIFCSVAAMFMAISYEFSGIEGLGFKNVLLSFILFLAVNMIISRPKGRYRINILVMQSLVTVLSISNIIKVRFQLSEISFWDIKLIQAAGGIAGLFITELPFVEIGIALLIFGMFVIFTKYYDKITVILKDTLEIEELYEIDGIIEDIEYFLSKKISILVPVAVMMAFVMFTSQVTSVFSTSSFGEFINSGKTLTENLMMQHEKDVKYQKTIIRRAKIDRLAKLDREDPLMTGYPFNKQDNVDVVVIQSETFFDLDKYQKKLGKKGINIHHPDINRNFHYYQKHGISGMFYVPTVGGGTVNTEYEVMTGYGARYFQKGSIVFTSVLEEPTNSLAYYYKNLMEDVKTTGIHNHEASYWDRDEAYPNLGFDKYVDMSMFTKKQQKDVFGAWMSDKTIFDRTRKELEENKDKNHFLLAVTVQNHGPFNDSREYIKVDNLTKRDNYQICNFAANLKYSDKQLKDFMDYIDKREKPTIVVFYGDHKPDPSYDIFQESEYYMKNNRRNLYNTDYFIYFNKAVKDKKLLALKGKKMNLSAPAMNRYIQMLLGDDTKFTRYVYNYTKNPDNYFNENRIKGIEPSIYADISKYYINTLWKYDDLE